MKTIHLIQAARRGALLAAFVCAPALPALATGGGQGRDISTGPSRATQTLPATLRPALYRALAGDAGSAYRVAPDGCATLPKQSLKACFDAGGVHFKGAGSPLALHLIGYGRGAKRMPVTWVRPEITDNRVRYRHGNLTEWWRVLPMGFEQGFTLTKRPDGNGMLTLFLAASAQAEQKNEGISWGKLRYGKLVVTDANDKVVPAAIKSEGDRILIAVNDTHAAYPLTVDPLVWIEQEVASSDGAAGDSFGISVALDGDTALIGAPFKDTDGDFNRGAAYLFVKSNGVWAEEQELVASDGVANDFFGDSVALDGTTALVGAPQVTVGDQSRQGAAYVFVNSGGSWIQETKLTSADAAAYDGFGWAVALSGTTALIGAPHYDFGGTRNPGAVYVFSGSGDSWTQTQRLVPPDSGVHDYFGMKIALDGETALVGASSTDVGDNNLQGAAYVFTDSDGTWSLSQELVSNDGATGDNFGWSVALDGTTALIGALGADNWQGKAYVFTNAAGTWSQMQELAASNGAPNDEFGYAVALSGTTALVGTADGGGYEEGAAYQYDGSGGTWSETREILARDGVASAAFGYAMALDGDTALISAPYAYGEQGFAYFYGESDLGLAVSAPQTVGQGQQYVSQTITTNNASASSPAVTATMAVPAAASFVSATATQGNCSEDSGVVTCDFGSINGNAGTATANVTLKATGDVGETIGNTASIAQATPPLTASAPTTIGEGAACPEGYTEYDGNLNPGQRAHSPIYQAPAGKENAILTGPDGFQLYAVFQNARYGRKIFRIPGNEVHRHAPAGYFTWVVKAGGAGGAYTLCVLHP